MAGHPRGGRRRIGRRDSLGRCRAPRIKRWPAGGPSVVVPAHIVDGRKQLRPFEKGARAKVPRWTFRVGFRNGKEWDNPLVTT